MTFKPPWSWIEAKVEAERSLIKGGWSRSGTVPLVVADDDAKKWEWIAEALSWNGWTAVVIPVEPVRRDQASRN